MPPAPPPDKLPGMVAILEEPEIRRLVTLMPVALYHRFGEFQPNGQRTELIRGIVIDKMSKTPLHVAVLYHLLTLMQTATVSSQMFVRKEDPLTLLDSEPEPDIAVVAGTAAGYNLRHPSTAHLVIEIAVTSLELDRVKAALYAEADIPEYWIVNPAGQAIEVYTAPIGGLYTQRRTYARGETLLSSALPTLRLDLDTLFAA